MLPGRTTSPAVQGIITTQLGFDITPFIDAANELVTEICATVFPGWYETTSCDGFPIYKPVKGGFTYSTYRLELIERWLSAHYYAVYDPRPILEKAGSVEERFPSSPFTLGLDSSLYGQMAMRLDVQGGLAVWNNGQKKYAKIPPAIFQGVPIGVHAGRASAGWGPRYPWYGGGWGSGW